MKSISLTIWLLAPTILWIGCAKATTNLQMNRELRIRIEPHESVVVLVSQEVNQDKDLTFATASADCIRTSIRGAYPALQLISSEKFHQTAFPDITVQETPLTTQQMALVIKDAAFRDRIARIGVRYLIMARGSTVQENTKPVFLAIGALNAAFTAIGAKWERRSQLTATVFDLQKFSAAGEIVISNSGQPWLVCVGVLVFCAPIGAPAFTESEACKDLGEGVVKFLAGEDPPEKAFVYGEDDRVRYSYNPKADPSERYLQALELVINPIDGLEDKTCAKLKACVERYVEEARQRAEKVGYKLTTLDEETFRKDLELAARLDNGEITREEAFRQTRLYEEKITTLDAFEQKFTSRCRDRRKTFVSRDLYVGLHKLTSSLLDEVTGRSDAVIKDAVARYVNDVRQLAAGSNYSFMCSDHETFMLELAIAEAADEGRIARITAVTKLENITTRHLINLFIGRP